MAELGVHVHSQFKLPTFDLYAILHSQSVAPCVVPTVLHPQFLAQCVVPACYILHPYQRCFQKYKKLELEPKRYHNYFFFHNYTLLNVALLVQHCAWGKMQELPRQKCTNNRVMDYQLLQ